MKRIIAICLVMILMGSAAIAAEWPEGMSANKPYTGSPEVDFNETIGYMILMPLKGSTVKAGELTLSIYMPRTDVKIGEGKLTLNCKEDRQAEEVEFNEENVVLREMTEEELTALLWGSGVVFEIALEKPLTANRNYYVQLSEGCIASEEYEAKSPKISRNDVWYFNTNTPNYIENVKYYRMADGKEKAVSEESVKAGDMVRIKVNMGGEAVAYAICCDQGVIKPEETYFEEAGETSIQFPNTGEVIWSVVYMDAEGKHVDEVSFVTQVQP